VIAPGGITHNMAYFSHAGIHTGREINARFHADRTRLTDRRPPKRATMPQHQRETKRNYIGILCDKTEQRTADTPANSGRLIKGYLLGLMAAVLHRDAGPA
jgi:hypothetical protein